MTMEQPSRLEEFRKLLKEYAQYSVNLKNWLYEDMASIIGQYPPQWLFEIVYRNAHSPLVYWMREKPGIDMEQEDTPMDQKETMEEVVERFGLVRDGSILRIGKPISSSQLQELKKRMRRFDYELVEQKGVFRPKWNGVKK